MTDSKRISLLLFAIVLFCINPGFTSTKTTLKVGEVVVNPGEKKSGFIKVPAGADGPEVQIPITMISGKNSGPVLALISGIHGYEYPPILALQRLINQIDPVSIRGTIIIVHIANVPSFLKRTIYYNPYDWKNQNRVFPGEINGSMTERIAYHITNEVLEKCDYLLDLHCGDGNEDLMTYLYYTETGKPELDRKTRELALNFGFKVIIHVKIDPKTQPALMCANAALYMEKPALTVECGRLGRTDEEDIVTLINGCLNTLKYLNMLEGKPQLIFEPIWVKKTTYIRSEHEGIFYALSYRGHYVKKGELLGYLTDFFGNIIQKALAPHDGIIMYIVATPPMSKGEPMVKIGGF